MASSSSNPSAVPPGGSGSSVIPPRPKQAMDIRIQELTDCEVQLLTGLLSRRPSFGIARPSKRWFEHQADLVAKLPPEIRRPANLLKRFVIKYGGDRSIFEYPPAVLCPTHYELNPRLMRRLFVVVLDEVTRHADRLRRWVASSSSSSATTTATAAAEGDEAAAAAAEADPEMVAFVDRVDGLGALWMEPELYLETFHAPPSDRRMVKVESFCEACTLAVLGASARTLADIRAIIVDRAERLRERRDRRRRGEEEERQRRQRRREEKREERKQRWEEEERLLEEAKQDPERQMWLRSGRAPDAEREQYHTMLDEMQARHLRHRDGKESKHHHRHRSHTSSSSRHPSSSSRGGNGSRQRRRGSKHREDEPPRDHQQQQDRLDREPRLLRIVEIWIDHLGPERAAIARGMSNDLLGLLRHHRRQIDDAARARARTTRQRRRVRRDGIPVAAAAPATNPQDAAELRRKAAEFNYRNSRAARSVYRPDSLAGGYSEVGGCGVENMPLPPMCGTGGDRRPGAPEPSPGRFSGFGSGVPPSAGFIRRFEREMQVGGGGDGDEEASGLDPYDGEDGGGGGGYFYNGEYYEDEDDLDEEEEDEDEEDDEDEDDGMGYRGAEGERDLEREERSREKVAAWAVHTWAESHRDLSGAAFERGAQSVIDGMHPAFRPDNNRNATSAPVSGSTVSFRRGSAVPLPLSVGGGRDKYKDKEKEMGRDPPPPSSSRKASSIIGSALGISRRNSNSKKRRAEEEEAAAAAEERERERGREREKKKNERLKEKQQRSNTPSSPKSTAWTDFTVRSDWRDQSPPNLNNHPPPPPVPRVPSRYANTKNRSGDLPSRPERSRSPPAPSATAGMDPNQPAGHDGQDAETGGVGYRHPQQPQPEPVQRFQTPPWSPARKPSRKYCFPDSDIGSAVRGKVDRQYLKKNRGIMREVPPDANPFASSSLNGGGGGSRSSGSRRRQDQDSGDDGDGSKPIIPGAADDPWASYERRAGEGEDDFIRPDDSASNVHWANARQRGRDDEVTQLGGFLGE